MADDWLNIASRFVLYVSMASAFGVALFGLYALHPLERTSLVAQRYQQLVGSLAALAIFVSLWSMAVVAKMMSGAPGYGELSTHIFETILTGTPLGQAWILRIVALGLCIPIAVLNLNATHRFTALVASSGIALATLAWSGHGAMDDGARGYIHLGTDIAHLWAAGAWIGALAAFLLLATAATDGEHNSITLLSRTASGFAHIGTLIVGTLTVTGLVNYQLIAGATFDPFVSTRYGRLLAVKLTLFAGMLVLAAVNRYRLSSRLKSAIASGDIAFAAATLRKSLLVESTLALLILICVAWLGVLSPT